MYIICTLGSSKISVPPASPDALRKWILGFKDSIAIWIGEDSNFATSQCTICNSRAITLPCPAGGCGSALRQVISCSNCMTLLWIKLWFSYCVPNRRYTEVRARGACRDANLSRAAFLLPTFDINWIPWKSPLCVTICDRPKAERKKRLWMRFLAPRRGNFVEYRSEPRGFFKEFSSYFFKYHHCFLMS